MAEIHAKRIDDKKFSTILRGDIKVVGNLFFSKPVLIKCYVRGDIKSESSIVIDASAKIEANIVAEYIRIRGNVNGNLTASKEIELDETAIVVGNISAPNIVMESGSRFGGMSQMAVPEQNTE